MYDREKRPKLLPGKKNVCLLLKNHTHHPKFWLADLVHVHSQVCDIDFIETIPELEKFTPLAKKNFESSRKHPLPRSLACLPPPSPTSTPKENSIQIF